MKNVISIFNILILFSACGVDEDPIVDKIEEIEEMEEMETNEDRNDNDTLYEFYARIDGRNS